MAESCAIARSERILAGALKKTATVLILSILAQTAAVTTPAFAQDDATTLQARARFKEGVEAFDKGKYEEARLAFLQAYTLKKHPAVLLNLAQSSAKSNHPLEAAGYFKQFLKESTTASPQQKKDAEAGLADVRKKIGTIDVVAAAGTQVTMDDQPVGTTPLGDVLDVEPGQHTLKGAGQTVTVTASVGQKTEARLLPQDKPAPVTPPPVTPPPDTKPDNPPPGPEGTPTKPDAHEKPGLTTAPTPMWPVYVGLGVGAVGLAGTIIFAAFKGSAQSKADSVAATIRDKAVNEYNIPAQGACNNSSVTTQFAGACQTLKNNNDNVNTDATVANVSVVVMIVGFVGAGAYYLFGPKKDEAAEKGAFITKPTITPWGGWQSGGLSFSANLL